MNLLRVLHRGRGCLVESQSGRIIRHFASSQGLPSWVDGDESDKHSQLFKKLGLLKENAGVFDGKWRGNGPVRLSSFYILLCFFFPHH